MANIKQQKKRNLTSELARQRNQQVRARLRTMMKKAYSAIEAKDEDQKKVAVPEAVSAIDRACAKGIIHRNNAARKKSELMHSAAR